MVFEKLQNMISEQMGIDKSEIKLQTDIIKDIGADSLDMVEILMNVESEWGIEVDDSEVGDIKTIADVVEFIENKIK